MPPYTFVFIGRSGCGKGTQADLLQEELKKSYPENPIFYLETGQRFRDFIQVDGYSSKLSKKLYQVAEPQPSFLAIWMWSHLLVEKLTGSENLVIDGTPRTYSESLVFATAMKFYNRKPYVIYVNVSREWSEKRLLSRGREDDIKLEDVKRRLDWFDKDIAPAVEYFRFSPDVTFMDINGEQTIADVQAEIMKHLSAIFPSQTK